MQFGMHQPAHRTLVHISDTHLLAGGARLHDRFAVEDNLRRALRRVEQTGISPDALVFTGDLTDLGEPDAYARLRSIVEPFAAQLEAPIAWVAGNHDERPQMRRDLLDEEPSEKPIHHTWDLDGLRLIALDSTVPGWHHGDLDEAQLEWLAAELAEPAPLGTILALHHPPLPSHVPMFDILELRGQDRFADVLAGSDVRTVLAGHLHYSMHGTFAGIPVSVAAATCYTMDVAREPQRVNGMDAGQAFNLVHVYDDTITHTVVPVDGADPAGAFSPEFYARLAAMTPDERLEAFSRKPGR
ncbi:phosphodiesterase [Microbacterium sp. JB110]|uniref:phosphodiesterase n=1 Tax=Microbacterium sp. JB110 TaxID=2024477 RepID=UPI00097F0D58|nr:phosphodiesterase [Microbacterium sp. JB110]RCS59078.1 phosphodiesterase [Microbacterium sp. JB110]SJM68650.1 3',5'-cyclic-nucleotide phosphodiesterase [Frigoribacterium sp. JB110]